MILIWKLGSVRMYVCVCVCVCVCVRERERERVCVKIGVRFGCLMISLASVHSDEF